MTTVKYIVKRTLQTVALLWLLLTAIFVLFRLMPGNYVDLISAQGAPPSVIEGTRERLGLGKPIHDQYLIYLRNFLQLELGSSLFYGVPVWEYVSSKIFNSFILIAPAITGAYILGSVFGAYIGWARDSLIERWGIVPLVMMGALPTFFIGILLILVFAVWLNIFPTSGMITPETLSKYDSWWRPYVTIDFLKHAILPFFAIMLHYMYSPALIMRTSAVEVANKNFLEFHRRTGIGKYKTLRHLGKHASLPVITVFPVSMAQAVGGLVLVETVFNWPGIGYALVQAVFHRDYPILQFVFFLVAAFVVIGNFVVDIVYSLIDPRVTIGDEE